MNGKITTDYGFPLPRAFNADAHRTRELRAERNYDPAHEESEAARMAACMHDYSEQLYAYLELVRAFDSREAAIFFVDGPGGSNKSFLFEVFLHYTRGRGEIAAACVWSGLAATLLPGGRTCHARVGFLVPLPREDVVGYSDHGPCVSAAFGVRDTPIERAHKLAWTTSKRPVIVCRIGSPGRHRVSRERCVYESAALGAIRFTYYILYGY